MIEIAKRWVRELTVSRPDTSLREGAREALERYFQDLKQVELVPTFLILTENASSRQQRMLADVAAPALHPGDAWLALLKEHRHKHCRRLARACLREWSEQLTSGAIIQGIEKALQDQDDDRLHCLMRLTIELVHDRPTISLRAVERLLAKKSEAQGGWRRTNSLLGLRVKAFHTALLEVMAPADTPLAATAPQTDKELPLPADAQPLTAEGLPVPSEGDTSRFTKPGFWERLFRRFRRSN